MKGDKRLKRLQLIQSHSFSPDQKIPESKSKSLPSKSKALPTKSKTLPPMMEALTTKIESLDSRENPNEAVSDSPQIRFF